jgi:hypothetical protein
VTKVVGICALCAAYIGMVNIAGLASTAPVLSVAVKVKVVVPEGSVWIKKLMRLLGLLLVLPLLLLRNHNFHWLVKVKQYNFTIPSVSVADNALIAL